MCTGRIDPKFIFRSFLNGADGVYIGGCWLGQCHYITDGNYDALSMMHLSKKLLEHTGLNPDRLRLEWTSAGEGIRFAEIMNEFANKLRELGPLGSSEDLSEVELRPRLEEVVRLLPYIKKMEREKLAVHTDREEDYAKLFTIDEIDKLFTETGAYYIDPEKCQACMICFRRCPVQAIDGRRNRIHVIDQDKCVKCGTCYEVCPARFGAVKEILAKEVPPSLPVEARSAVNKGRTA